ncbi:hypothetical protein CLOACE_16080 [Clostridium acetireducens DSM 10703]|uniref:LUD domain-containing protein n=1 Tax=Clostridium acetireducens DSM 10703 TaxID=1121290 RepID=A0A1E8EXT0_9CLOT|nr:lactate utilization protein [Clostridium acetireducens]OFI05602.1 hypothetical protein CLOACE_16080 [Clostridium acetireducens DSM 10703]
MGNLENNKAIGEKVVKALKKNLFDADYCSNTEEAVEYIMKYVKPNCKIGFGGSVTIQSINVKGKINKLPVTILDHNDSNLSKEEKLEIKRQQLICDLFLCSSNAITLNGELVNIDGAGNRVAAMTFGPKKVIIVAGINKICSNEEEAFKRLKEVACIKNNKRLKLKNPCVETEKCVDCHSHTRICRVYSVIKRKPMNSDITVLVVGEELGY